MNICLIISGSVAAYKACELVSRLAKTGHTVQTVVSEGALHFIGESTLEALSGRQVYSQLWARRENMTHVSLRRWADLFVFYPASANRINQFAAGLASDLIGATFLANNFEKPFWICPAMNTNMREHPATCQSIETLSKWGCRILDGQVGLLACGDSGVGRAIEAQVLFELIQAEARQQKRALIANSNLATFGKPHRKLLITGGAMSEKIDGVREINNRSSGKTASAIAACFLDNGWELTYLHHDSASLEGSEGSFQRSYHDYQDLEGLLDDCLERQEWDLIIHAAAVSDYRLHKEPKLVKQQKLESGQNLNLILQPTAKLLDKLLEKAKGKPIICAFKLTVGQVPVSGLAKAQKFLDHNKADFVVWNDTDQIGPGRHHYTLISSQDNTLDQDAVGPNICGEANDEESLAKLLYKTCLKSLESKQLAPKESH